MTKLNNSNIFNDKEIENFTRLGKVLKGVHERLISEGYTINDEGIMPPKNELENGFKYCYNNYANLTIPYIKKELFRTTKWVVPSGEKCLF